MSEVRPTLTEENAQWWTQQLEALSLPWQKAILGLLEQRYGTQARERIKVAWI